MQEEVFSKAISEKEQALAKASSAKEKMEGRVSVFRGIHLLLRRSSVGRNLHQETEIIVETHGANVTAEVVAAQRFCTQMCRMLRDRETPTSIVKFDLVDDERHDLETFISC